MHVGGQSEGRRGPKSKRRPVVRPIQVQTSGSERACRRSRWVSTISDGEPQPVRQRVAVSCVCLKGACCSRCYRRDRYSPRGQPHWSRPIPDVEAGNEFVILMGQPFEASGRTTCQMRPTSISLERPCVNSRHGLLRVNRILRRYWHERLP